jgi:hypothetical protein
LKWSNLEPKWNRRNRTNRRHDLEP